MALDAERIRANVSKLKKSLKKVLKHSHPEEVHSLRTLTRRLEATVDALSLDSKRNERRLMKRLSRVQKKAGKVRDLDVLTSDISALHVKGETDCLIQLFQYLGARRYKYAAQLVRSIRQNRGVIRKRLRRTANRIDELLGNNDRASSQSEAVAATMASAMELSSELASTTNLNRGNLHEFRLKVKELRYVLQLSDNADHVRFIEMLGKVKDAIGEWHDWEELIAISTDPLNHGPSCKLLHKFRVISSHKYQYALFVANKMRKEYLKPADRNAKGRPGDKDKLERPVLKAVPAIAA